MQKQCHANMRLLGILIGLGLAGFMGCVRVPPSPPVDVVVGLPVIASLVHSVIAGGACKLKLHVLNPSSVQHTFELTPHHVAEIRQAPLTVMVGAAMDTWLLAARPQKSVQIEAWGILSSRGPLHQTDPHFWLDPKRSWTVAAHFAQVLHEQFPDRCDQVKVALQANELRWQHQMLAQKVRGILGWLSGAEVIAIHDAFQYFVDFLAEQGIHLTYRPQPEQGVGPHQLSEILKQWQDPHSHLIVWDVPPFSFCQQLEMKLGRVSSRCFRLDPTGSILSQQRPTFTYPEFLEHFLVGLNRAPP